MSMKSLVDTTARDTIYFGIICIVALSLGWLVYTRRYFRRLERFNYALLIIAFYMSILFLWIIAH